MRTRLYDDVRHCGDLHDFAGMRPLTKPAGSPGSMLAGTWRNRRRPVAANDNNPNKTTIMVAHNGGCSTTSGMVPVSVRRVSFMDGAQVAA